MDDRYCKICAKKYSSYKSLWNHVKKFHVENNSKSNPKVIHNTSKSNPKVTLDIPDVNNFKCRYCDKMYKYKQGKYKHEQLCNNKEELNDDSYKIAKLEKENLEIKNTLNELLKLCKIHPKKLQKINNQLITTNNGTINNITNNISIEKFGSEELNKILSQSEILKILDRKMCSLEESIKMIHFNDKRPEYKNIYITNLKDDYAYTYDGNKFSVGLKSNVLAELVDNHIENIEYSAEEYKQKLQPKTIEVLEKFIDKMNNDDEIFIDRGQQKSYPNCKSYTINEIKLMIYNMSDKNTNVMNIICGKNELPVN